MRYFTKKEAHIRAATKAELYCGQTFGEQTLGYVK